MNHDITHCAGVFSDGKECPCRHDCRRYRATQEPDMPQVASWLNPDSCFHSNFKMHWYENQWVKK